MMKYLKKLFVIAICLATFAGIGVSTGFMTESVNAADDYTYTVKVYSGKEGTFADGKTVHVYKNIPYGQEITVDINEGKSDYVEVKNPDKYYARGLKIAGHDNDETSKYNYRSYSFKVTGDESFSVAYGMKGGMVKYTVRYVDAGGATLHPAGEFYGMVGDYPVVSYQYVEGYTPNAYNLGKTLVDDESKNVFTFTYKKGEVAAADNADNAGADNANGGAGNGNGAGDGNGAGAGTGDGTGENNGPQTFVDLDEQDQPLVETPDNTVPGAEAGTSEISKQFKWGIALAVICGILLAALAIFLILRHKREEEELEKEFGTEMSGDYDGADDVYKSGQAGHGRN